MHGGPWSFEHNLQSLRVVDTLEDRYPAYDGINLTYETREGILKHCSRRNAEQLEAREPGGVGRRFLLGQQPSLELSCATWPMRLPTTPTISMMVCARA